MARTEKPRGKRGTGRPVGLPSAWWNLLEAAWAWVAVGDKL